MLTLKLRSAYGAMSRLSCRAKTTASGPHSPGGWMLRSGHQSARDPSCRCHFLPMCPHGLSSWEQRPVFFTVWGRPHDPSKPDHLAEAPPPKAPQEFRGHTVFHSRAPRFKSFFHAKYTHPIQSPSLNRLSTSSSLPNFSPHFLGAEQRAVPRSEWQAPQGLPCGTLLLGARLHPEQNYTLGMPPRAFHVPSPGSHGDARR